MSKPSITTLQSTSLLQSRYICACRSYKAGHLAKSNWVEICNWNHVSQQQFRLRGPVTVVDGDNSNEALQTLRQREYKRLGTPSVLQWYHNADRPPGRPFQAPVQQDVDQQVLQGLICAAQINSCVNQYTCLLVQAA